MRRKKKPHLVVINRKMNPMASAHGGAWKVAYADFVTAMMAFFLLLWLLNASSRAQVSGIAEFFAQNETNPTEGVVSDTEGDFELAGESEANTELLQFDVSNPTVLKLQEVPRDLDLGSTEKIALKTLSKDEANIEVTKKIQTEVSRNSFEGIPVLVEESTSNVEAQNTLLVESRSDGLEINITHRVGVFEANSAILTPQGEKQLAQIATLLASRYENVKISIEGHSASKDGINLWQLSIDRAFAVMRWLVNNRFNKDKIITIDGFANKQLLDPDQFDSVINDRVVLKFIDFDTINRSAR